MRGSSLRRRVSLDQRPSSQNSLCGMSVGYCGVERRRTHRSWSKEEGIGVSPEAESGIGARDMVGRLEPVAGL